MVALVTSLLPGQTAQVNSHAHKPSVLSQAKRPKETITTAHNWASSGTLHRDGETNSYVLNIYEKPPKKLSFKQQISNKFMQIFQPRKHQENIAILQKRRADARENLIETLFDPDVFQAVKSTRVSRGFPLGARRGERITFSTQGLQSAFTAHDAGARTNNKVNDTAKASQDCKTKAFWIEALTKGF